LAKLAAKHKEEVSPKANGSIFPGSLRLGNYSTLRRYEFHID